MGTCNCDRSGDGCCQRRSSAIPSPVPGMYKGMQSAEQAEIVALKAKIAELEWRLEGLEK